MNIKINSPKQELSRIGRCLDDITSVANRSADDLVEIKGVLERIAVALELIASSASMLGHR